MEKFLTTDFHENNFEKLSESIRVLIISLNEGEHNGGQKCITLRDSEPELFDLLQVNNVKLHIRYLSEELQLTPRMS